MHEPDAENIYSMIGFTLLQIQSMEGTMKFCTTFVLGGDEPNLTWEMLQSSKKHERKKALGYFVKKLQARANLHPSFEKLLESVLLDRNNLVHNTSAIPGWNLATSEGISVATAFTISLLRRAYKIHEILTALSLKWQAQVNIEVAVSPECETLLRDIENRYGHLVAPIFGHGKG